jgi:hypothetical protein
MSALKKLLISGYNTSKMSRTCSLKASSSLRVMFRFSRSVRANSSVSSCCCSSGTCLSSLSRSAAAFWGPRKQNGVIERAALETFKNKSYVSFFPGSCEIALQLVQRSVELVVAGFQLVDTRLSSREIGLRLVVSVEMKRQN